MSRTIEVELYQFDELSDAAKDKARAWYRDGQLDYDWWDTVYDDADTIAECLGITLDNKGKKTRIPAIYFSGFSSQGDGACFEGRYRYKKGWRAALEGHAPEAGSEKNAELHKIGQLLQEVQARHFYQLEATVKQSGHYNHSGCTSIEVSHCESMYRDIGGAEDDVKTALRLFMDWIYDQLESEYEYLTSDEQVDQVLSDGDDEFEADGTHH